MFGQVVFNSKRHKQGNGNNVVYDASTAMTSRVVNGINRRSLFSLLLRRSCCHSWENAGQHVWTHTKKKTKINKQNIKINIKKKPPTNKQTKTPTFARNNKNTHQPKTTRGVTDGLFGRGLDQPKTVRPVPLRAPYPLKNSVISYITDWRRRSIARARKRNSKNRKTSLLAWEAQLSKQILDNPGAQ
jgi:hypothetical protein